MAGDDKKPVIVIKKIQGGHGGAHGGAWKVAFADFMTALMCFFLVMWLMGSDEEVRSVIAEHFNSPSSPWRKDLHEKDTYPLGDKTGAGENVLKGAEGRLPDTMVKKPDIPYHRPMERTPQSTQDDINGQSGIVGAVEMDIQSMVFSIPEDIFFKARSDEFSENADRYIQRLERVLRGYPGELTLEGSTLPVPDLGKEKRDPYEFALARLVRLKRFLTENKYIESGRIHTKVTDRKPASHDEVIGNRGESPRKITFILKELPK